MREGEREEKSYRMCYQLETYREAVASGCVTSWVIDGHTAQPAILHTGPGKPLPLSDKGRAQFGERVWSESLCLRVEMTSLPVQFYLAKIPESYRDRKIDNDRRLAAIAQKIPD